MTEGGDVAKRIATLEAKADLDIANEDAVMVVLAYDMGIAPGRRSHGYSCKPGELH